MNLLRPGKSKSRPEPRRRYDGASTSRQRPQSPGHARDNNYSYYNSRSNNRINVGRLETKSSGDHGKWCWLWRHSLIIISVLVIVFCGLSELVVKPDVEVSVLGKSRQASLITDGNTEKYASFVDALINNSFANKNKLTIDTAKISVSTKRHFPEIDSVSLVLPFLGSRPRLYVQVYQPAFALLTSNGVFAVSQSGKAIATTTKQSANSLGVPVVTDDSSLTAQVGSQVLSSDDGVFIDYVDTELENADLKVSKIVLSASRELDVYFQGQSYFAKFNLERGNPRQQVGALIAVVHQLKRNGQTPRQYVDVRLDGRAYYK